MAARRAVLLCVFEPRGADPALEFIVLKHRMRLCRRCRLRLCGGGRDTIYSTGRLSVYAMLSLGTGRALHA